MTKLLAGLKSVVTNPHFWVDVVLVGSALEVSLHEPWKGLLVSVLAVVSFYFHTQP